MMKMMTCTALMLACSGAMGMSDVFVLDDAGFITRIDLDTGATTPAGSLTGSPASMAGDADRLVVGYADGTLLAIDPASGLVNATVFAAGNNNAIALLGETVYTADSGSFDATVRRYDIDSGFEHGSFGVGTDVTDIAIDAGGVFVGGHSTVAERGTIGGVGFQFFAACGGLINSMAFSDDTMYLGGVAFAGDLVGTIYEFDKFAGGVFYTGTFGVDSDAIAMHHDDGALVIAGSDGVIRQIDPDTGADLATPIATGLSIVDMASAGATTCAIDIQPDGVVNVQDVLFFIDEFVAGHSSVDLNGDGLLNTADVTVFIDLFLAGC